MATYRGADANPKEQFLYHTAGFAGSGSGSYIDAMLLRDDHDPDDLGWEDAADATLERRVYYVQNWRWDIVALLADNGRVLERAWHEPYGTPWGLPAADLTTSNASGSDDYGVPDGDGDIDDHNYFTTLYGASSTRADLTGSATSTDFAYGRPDGTVDIDDSNYYLDILAAADTLGRGSLSAEDGLRNRRGLSGYEWDPTHGKYQVRHRVLRPETGRWTRRDPLGFWDGLNWYRYSSDAPVANVDATGLACAPCGGGDPPTEPGPKPGPSPATMRPHPLMPPPAVRPQSPRGPRINPYPPCFADLDWSPVRDAEDALYAACPNLVMRYLYDSSCPSGDGLTGPKPPDRTPHRRYDCVLEITICTGPSNPNIPNNPRDCKKQLDTMLHELRHAMQACTSYGICSRGWRDFLKDWNAEDNMICREVDAYCNESPTSCPNGVPRPSAIDNICRRSCDSLYDEGDKPRDWRKCKNRCAVIAPLCVGGKL